jgi:hypothetical protein
MELNNLKIYLADFGKQVTDSYREKIIKNKVVATGKLRDSIKYKVISTDDSIGVYLSAVDYWEYVEYGRKAGKFVPIKPLKNWLLQKGLKASPYAISKSIQKKGIKEKPFFRQSLNEFEIDLNKIDDLLQKDINEILNLKLNQTENIKWS